jgi:CheY-like chemotaxis protein
MAKILIVDDDADFRAISQAALEAGGYTIITADSGKAGLELAKSEKPDLIIADLMMETEDAGFILCRKVKQDQEIGNTPIIMMTAVTRETGFRSGWIPRIKSVGFRQMIMLINLSPPELVERVKRLLGTH